MVIAKASLARTMSGAMIACAMLGLNAESIAQHQGDVILSVSGNELRTFSASGTQLSPERVFGATFGDSGFAGRTTNPGFNALGGALPPGQTVGLSIRKAVRRWQDGRFCTIAEQRIQVRKSGVIAESPASDPTPGALGASIDVGVTGSDGGVHEHPAYWLIGPALDGVYLLEGEVYLGSPGGGSVVSPAIVWLVFGNNALPAEFDAAQVWASANLASGAGNPCCRADFNGQGGVSVQDVFDFLSAWFAGEAGADFNGAGGVSVQDIFDFLTAWFAGCA